MRLIDRLSGPAGKVEASLRGLNSASKSLMMGGAISRGMNAYGRSLRFATYNTAALSGGLTLAGAGAAKSVYDFEKMGNALQAVTGFTDDQRAAVEQYAKELNKTNPFTNTKSCRPPSNWVAPE